MDPILMLIGICVFFFVLWLVSIFVRNNRKKEYLAELQQLPEPERQAKLANQENKKKWGCVSGYLILVMLANIAVAILTFMSISTVDSSSGAGAILMFSGGLNLLAALFAGVIYWGHKKWAVYGIYGIIALSLVINLVSGNVTGAAQNLLPILILSVAIRPVWDQLE